MRVAIVALALSSVAGLSSCEDSCIAADTLVDTPDGPRALGALAVGDRVRSVDPVTGDATAARVVAVRRAVRETIALSTGDGHRLVCTTDHPLYDPDARAWAPAGDWALGLRASLLAADRERPRAVRVTAVEPFAGAREVVDITTDDEPHAFVAAGLVVHNKSRAAPASCAATTCACVAGDAGSVHCYLDGLPRCACTDASAPADGDADATPDDGASGACYPDLVPGARSGRCGDVVYFGTPCAERCLACAATGPDGGPGAGNPAPCVCDGTAWRCPSDVGCGAVGESRWLGGPPPRCP